MVKLGANPDQTYDGTRGMAVVTYKGNNRKRFEEMLSSARVVFHDAKYRALREAPCELHRFKNRDLACVFHLSKNDLALLGETQDLVQISVDCCNVLSDQKVQVWALFGERFAKLVASVLRPQ